MTTVYLKEGESLCDALAVAVPFTIIVLLPACYREKVVVNVSDIIIVGTDGKSCIVYDDYANKLHSDGKEFNTFRTYTVCVTEKNVTFKNLTIENSSYSPQIKGQAVALSVYGDNFKGENLILKSAQDTLFIGPLPDDLITRYDSFLPDDQRYYEGEMVSNFKNCDIYGSVDYVFGCSVAFFNKCKFVNIDDGRTQGYVCAPAHSLKQKLGFVFYQCEFLADKNLKAQIYLARPWRDYGKCTFIDCKIDNHISPLSFDKWNDTERNKTARFEYYECNLKTPVTWSKPITKKSAAQILKYFNIILK